MQFTELECGDKPDTKLHPRAISFLLFFLLIIEHRTWTTFWQIVLIRVTVSILIFSHRSTTHLFFTFNSTKLNVKISYSRAKRKHFLTEICFVAMSKSKRRSSYSLFLSFIAERVLSSKTANCDLTCLRWKYVLNEKRNLQKLWKTHFSRISFSPESMSVVVKRDRVKGGRRTLRRNVQRKTKEQTLSSSGWREVMLVERFSSV